MIWHRPLSGNCLLKNRPQAVTRKTERGVRCKSVGVCTAVGIKYFSALLSVHEHCNQPQSVRTLQGHNRLEPRAASVCCRTSCILFWRSLRQHLTSMLVFFFFFPVICVRFSTKSDNKVDAEVISQQTRWHHTRFCRSFSVCSCRTCQRHERIIRISIS